MADDNYTDVYVTTNWRPHEPYDVEDEIVYKSLDDAARSLGHPITEFTQHCGMWHLKSSDKTIIRLQLRGSRAPTADCLLEVD
jgi:hypothetical protein